jgi:hypothetical protein
LRIPTAQAHVEGELQRERAAAARDVNIALAPFDLRRQAGTEHLFEQRTDMKPTTIYNLTGPQARVNIHSIDASTNVVNVSAFSLFDSIREGEVVGCDGLARADMHTASATNHRPKPTLSRAGWHPNKLIAARTYRGTTHVPVTRSCQLSDECTIVQMAPAVDTVNVTATRRKLQVSLDLRLPESGAFWVAATPA